MDVVSENGLAASHSREIDAGRVSDDAEKGSAASHSREIVGRVSDDAENGSAASHSREIDGPIDLSMHDTDGNSPTTTLDDAIGTFDSFFVFHVYDSF